MPAANIIFMDGFDHYNTSANVADKWNTSGTTHSFTSGRISGSAIRLYGTADRLSRSFSNNQFVCVSFGFYATSLGSTTTQICALTDGASVQVDLSINPNYTLSITRNGTALTNGTSTLIIKPYTWNWIEFKVMIADSISANSCQVQVNGELVINVSTGQDTKVTTNAYANGLRLNVLDTTNYVHYDDFILQVGSGSDFLGDTKIITSFPSSNGSSSSWTGSDGNSTDNYLLVDETNPDDDTTYVQSDTVGQKDLYGFPSLGSTATSIVALGVDINCRKTDATSRTICAVVKSGATEQDGANVAVTDTYFYQIQNILPTNPNTGTAWTQATVEAAEIGQKVIA
jgi:hypothetical protein